MRTVPSSLSTAGSSSSNNHLNSSTSTLLSADTGPLMSAGSCSTYAPDTYGIIGHVTLKIEFKKETGVTAKLNLYRLLQEPEFQRMSSLRSAACKRKEVDNTPYIPSTSKAHTAMETSQSSFTSGDKQPDEYEDYEGGHSEALGVIVGTPAPQDSSSQQVSSEQSQLPSTSHPATKHHHSGSKKPRLVFTESQKRTLLAIFKDNRRPNKDMQFAVAELLNLDITTVSNFFMDARRRSQDKWLEDAAKAASTSGGATATDPVC